MRCATDKIGRRYNKLVVLGREASNKHGQSQWLCKCDCGNSKIITGGFLESGHTKSCGCLLSNPVHLQPYWNKSREDNANWKGGKWINKSGYVEIRVGDQYCLEHRHVMSEHLGRPLTSIEIVHHKNGIRTDNHLGNLELCLKKSHPNGQRVVDLVNWARHILEQYEKETSCGLIG
jgi:hypothetical protein